MTTFDKNLLLVLITLLGLVTVPMAFAGLEAPFGGISYIPIMLFVELLIYFIAAMIMNSRANAAMAVGSAVLFAILRAVCSFAGAILYSIFSSSSGADVALLWANPLSAMVQVILLILAGPYLLAWAIPDLIGKEQADLLRGDSASSSLPSRPSGTYASMESAPTGGFVQVFSFEELAAQLKKSPGLEGFVLHNEEGLVVWRELPLKLDVEVLTARLVTVNRDLGGLLTTSGLSRLRRISIESRDHSVFAAGLNQNFGLILFFSGRTPSEDVQSRLPILTKTAREFLQWKYPSMPMSSGHSRDRVSTEMA